jgi:hypothetical protein
MAKVNYIRECRAFTMIAAEERFTANEVVLWHALFELFNRKAEGDEWPEGFVQISNAKLLPMTTFGVGDSGCETLRKARERMQARGLIKYRKGKRGALTPEYCLCYFYTETAQEIDSADRVKTSMSVRPQGTIQVRRTGILLGKPLGRSLGRPLGKPLGKPSGKPLGKPLDIPLNVNVNTNVNPNPCQTQFLTGSTNPRAIDDQRHAGISEYDQGWKTSARARGAVAQRLLDKYCGLLDTNDAWGDLCEVMADGLDPGTIERVIPTRPCFSKLIARLRAVTLCRGYDSPGQGSQGAPRAGPGP